MFTIEPKWLFKLTTPFFPFKQKKFHIFHRLFFKYLPILYSTKTQNQILLSETVALGPTAALPNFQCENPNRFLFYPIFFYICTNTFLRVLKNPSIHNLLFHLHSYTFKAVHQKFCSFYRSRKVYRSSLADSNSIHDEYNVLMERGIPHFSTLPVRKEKAKAFIHNVFTGGIHIARLFCQKQT